MPAVLLHLSDPHFGTEEPAVVAAVQRLAHEQRPDAVILSGDITQRARSAQFAAARAFCDALGVQKLLVLPGNHDIPLYNVAARLFAPYAGYEQCFGRNLEPELELPQVLVVGVNTTRPQRHTDGEISRAQIERVARRVQGMPREVLRVVVTHQPACVMRPEDEKDRLHGGPEAVQAWVRAGADLVLGGHIHLPYVADFCTRHESGEHRLYCVQAGTACSRRVRHGTPNSLNIVRWDPPAHGEPRVCKVERWDYDLADDRFELTHTYDLQLGG
jgi:3',5'-cyclic AMP phosphodiesterase CpdA